MCASGGEGGHIFRHYQMVLEFVYEFCNIGDFGAKRRDENCTV